MHITDTFQRTCFLLLKQSVRDRNVHRPGNSSLHNNYLSLHVAKSIGSLKRFK